MCAYVLGRPIHLVSAIGILAALGGLVPGASRAVAAQQADCNRPFRDAVMVFDAPGGEPTPTRDGCWVFTVTAEVAQQQARAGLNVLKRTAEGVALHRFVPLAITRFVPNGPAPVGLALTHDETILVVSHDRRITFLDVGRLKGSMDAVLGFIESPRLARSWGVTVSPDDRYAFAAQQGTSSVVIVDLEKVRKGVFDQSALAGLIPTAPGATTPSLSRDGRYLYTTTLREPDVVTATAPCAGTKDPEGAIQVVDVQRAGTDAASATVGFAYPAGCSPIFVTTSRDGTRIAAVAPGRVGVPEVSALDSAITVFDGRAVGEGKPPTFIARIRVPALPTRVVDVNDRLFVSFHHVGSPPPSAHVLAIDAKRLTAGQAAIIGRLPVAGLEIAVTADGRTLLASQAGWTKLAVVDLQRVTLEPVSD